MSPGMLSPICVFPFVSSLLLYGHPGIIEGGALDMDRIPAQLPVGDRKVDVAHLEHVRRGETLGGCDAEPVQVDLPPEQRQPRAVQRRAQLERGTALLLD